LAASPITSRFGFTASCNPSEFLQILHQPGVIQQAAVAEAPEDRHLGTGDDRRDRWTGVVRVAPPPGTLYPSIFPAF